MASRAPLSRNTLVEETWCRFSTGLRCRSGDANAIENHSAFLELAAGSADSISYQTRARYPRIVRSPDNLSRGRRRTHLGSGFSLPLWLRRDRAIEFAEGLSTAMASRGAQ